MRLILRLSYFLILAAAGASCVNDMDEVRALTEKKVGVDEAKQIETYLSQGGRMKAQLTAPLMLRYLDTVPRIEFPKTLHVNFYDTLLNIESTLDANYGRYLEGQNKVFLKDSIVVINRANRDTLRCQELWWDQNRQIFYTDKPVRIYQRDKTVFGQGLEAKQDFTEYKILRITGELLVEDESF